MTAFSESVALRFNELGWLTFVMIAVKLSRWGEDPLADPARPAAAPSPVPAAPAEPVVYTA
ncbi:MAG: hypothetical protein M3M95_01645 [Pseudomonadota bacterium]|nr:hypothetical protein [Pseudomonadota bacterium]